MVLRDLLTGIIGGANVVRMGTTVRQSVTLTKPQDKALEAEARRLGITKSDLLRRIVDSWREQKEKSG